MSRRVPTLLDHIWHDALEFSKLADTWSNEVVVEMLTLVWQAYDELKAKHLAGVDFAQPMEQLERSLTDLHAGEIMLLWKAQRSGFESFIPQHEAWEFAHRHSRSAMPPSYDIGFVNVNDRRIRWPVEAKVLNNSGDVHRYLGDLKKKYLSGKGAPLTNEAALLGYLRIGLPKDAFNRIGLELKQELTLFVPFQLRNHRVSKHKRTMHEIKGGTPTNFFCHHLLAVLS